MPQDRGIPTAIQAKRALVSNPPRPIPKAAPGLKILVRPAGSVPESSSICHLALTGRISALQKNPAAVELLRKVLTEGQVTGSKKTSRPLRFCHRWGWLQAELLDGEVVYVIPINTHKRYGLFYSNKLPSLNS